MISCCLDENFTHAHTKKNERNNEPIKSRTIARDSTVYLENGMFENVLSGQTVFTISLARKVFANRIANGISIQSR